MQVRDGGVFPACKSKAEKKMKEELFQDGKKALDPWHLDLMTTFLHCKLEITVMTAHFLPLHRKTENF